MNIFEVVHIGLDTPRFTRSTAVNIECNNEVRLGGGAGAVAGVVGAGAGVALMEYITLLPNLDMNMLAKI